MITVAPTAAPEGLKPEIEGVGRTLKLDELVTVTPLVVTEIVPSVAPAGTEVVILIAVEAVTTANVPLNLTMLFDGVVLKFVPEIVTIVPTAPSVGSKLVMVGDGSTVKFDELEIVTPLVVTMIGPVPAPEGTVVVILVELELMTFAGTPLNVTRGVPVKFVPEIVTVAPTAPLVGLNPVIVGVANTLKLPELVAVSVPTVTSIFPGPDVTPAGTEVVILVEVDAATIAVTPLKVTMLFPGIGLKPVPEMVTEVPMAPLVGEKDVMVVGT